MVNDVTFFQFTGHILHRDAGADHQHQNMVGKIADLVNGFFLILFFARNNDLGALFAHLFQDLLLALLEQVGDDKYVSLITFNANANLKKVSTESSGIYVVGYKQLKKFMKKQTDKPDILTDEEIENIYQQLLPGTKLSDEEKQEHVNRIKQQYKK